MTEAKKLSLSTAHSDICADQRGMRHGGGLSSISPKVPGFFKERGLFHVHIEILNLC